MKKTIGRIVDYAVHVSDPEEIIIFGSMANGTNNIYSDVDLLVVVNEGFPKKQISEQIKQFAQEFAITADVLVYTKTDLEKSLEQPYTFIAGVLKSGKIVYKKGK